MMGAIVARYGAGEATVRAFLAGSDLLLYPSNPDSAFAAMNAAVANGRISMARLDSSVHRLLEIKSHLGLFTQRYASLSGIMATVGAKRFQTAAQDLAVRALTLVRDSTGTLARLRATRTRMALIAYADEFNGSVGLSLADILRQNGDTVDYFRLWPMSGTLSYDSARTVINRNPVAVFAANVKPISFRGNIALPDSLALMIAATDSLRPSMLVSFGSPYLLNQAPRVKTSLVAWSGIRSAERAAARAILGLSPIGGHLPIRVPPYPLGWGMVIPDSTVPPAPPIP